MAFNGSGTYSLPAGNPVVTGTTISSSTTNTTNSDIATALTNCITRDGQSTPSANLPMNAKKLTGLAAGTSAGDSVRYEQVVLTGAALGTPSSGTLTSCTGLPLTTGVTGTLPVGNGGTGVTTSTGSGNNVLSTSPTLTTPVLGTPSSGDLSSCTNAVGYGLKSATTTVSVSAATAPTSGQVLKATSSTTATWQTVGSSGLVFLSRVTASGAATADVETGFSSTYDSYLIVFDFTAGSSTTIAGYMKFGGAYNTGTVYESSANDTTAFNGPNIENRLTMFPVASIRYRGSLFIPNANSTANGKIAFVNSDTDTAWTGGAVRCSDNTSLQGVRFLQVAGFVTISGTFDLYGYTKA